MAKEQLVTIVNGDMETEVTPREAKVYERYGWTVRDDGSSEEEPKPAKKSTTRKAAE